MNTTTTTTTTTEASPAHPFQRAGLGLAPFRYLGIESQDIAYGERVLAGRDGNGPMVTTKPGGTCAYCGTYIVNMFRVKSSDGKTFRVGQDCIEKVYGPKHKITVAAHRAITSITKARKDARDTAKIVSAYTAIEIDSVRAALASKPHPTVYLANQGETLLGWAEYVLQFGGTSGKVRAAVVVLAALK